MHHQSSQKLLSASQETDYLASYINQLKLHCGDVAHVELYQASISCHHQLEHNLLMPLINDAFEFGIPGVEKPVIIFDLQLEDNRLTFCVHYKRNLTLYDERTKVTFLKFKQKLKVLYPDDYILYRDYYLDNYLVLVQINLS
jgi:hypothetical protein